MDDLDLFELTPILRLVVEEAGLLHTLLCATPGVSEAARKRAASLQANTAYFAVTKHGSISEADSIVAKLKSSMESKATIAQFIEGGHG